MSIYLSIYLSVYQSIYLNSFQILSLMHILSIIRHFAFLLLSTYAGVREILKQISKTETSLRIKAPTFLPRIKCKSQSKWGHHSITCNKMEIENFSVSTSAPLKVQFTKCCKNQIPLHYLCLLIQYFLFLGQTKQ